MAKTNRQHPVAVGYTCIPIGTETTDLPELKNQEREIRAFASEQGIDVAQVFQENIGSHYLKERVELLKLLNNQDVYASEVIIWSRKVISNNLFFVLWIEKELAKRRSRIRYISDKQAKTPLDNVLDNLRDYFTMLEMDVDHLKNANIARLTSDPVKQEPRTYEFKKVSVPFKKIALEVQRTHLMYRGFDLSKFLDLLQSPVMIQEIIWVLEGLKPVARLLFHEAYLNTILDFCAQQKLHVALGDYKLIEVPESYQSIGGINGKIDDGYGRILWSLVGATVKRSTSYSGHTMLYLSLDSELAYRAKEAEEAGNSKALGRLLGYPQCCVEAFEGPIHELPGHLGKIDLTKVNFMETLPFENNHFLLNEFCLGIVDYKPCSPKCSHTIKLTCTYWNCLKHVLPDFAKCLQEQLQGLLIAIKGEGIFFAKEYYRVEEVIKFGKLFKLDNGSKTFMQLLERTSEIKMMGQQTFIIDEYKLTENEVVLLCYG